MHRGVSTEVHKLAHLAQRGTAAGGGSGATGTAGTAGAQSGKAGGVEAGRGLCRGRNSSEWNSTGLARSEYVIKAVQHHLVSYRLKS